LSFEDTETIPDEHFIARNQQKVFSTLNNDCSTQDMSRELDLVSLEPPGNEDSEHVFKIFSSISVNEMAA
jgi:3-methyladenine DNA glycosylase Tag